jgi:hypothetical protein
LPELEPLLEMDRPVLWFPLPGGGGFRFWLEQPGVEAKLCCERWTRDAREPGERHEITSSKAILV